MHCLAADKLSRVVSGEYASVHSAGSGEQLEAKRRPLKMRGAGGRIRLRNNRHIADKETSCKAPTTDLRVQNVGMTERLLADSKITHEQQDRNNARC